MLRLSWAVISPAFAMGIKYATIHTKVSIDLSMVLAFFIEELTMQY
jgi:hypothetical protein